MKLHAQPTKWLQYLGFATLLLCFATACKKETTAVPDPVVFTPGMAPDIVFYGLTDNNKLNVYNAKTPGTVDASVTISGLPAGEKLLSIDFRPATGQLYALGSSSRLYFIQLNNGTAVPVGTAAFSPSINSQIANIDFNPTVDRIRLVTNIGQNLRLHPETGATAAIDGTINGAGISVITSIAYTNSKAGAAMTELYDIDIMQQKLFKQNPPNDGTLAEVGNLGVKFTGKGGFDIHPESNAALATFTVNDKTRLYSLNLGMGAATYVNDITDNLIDIAIPSSPVAYAVDETNNLLIFDPTKPQTVVTKAITGLQAGEQVQGIDIRPATGQLYAFASSPNGAARLYVLNLSSGAAAAVGTGFMVNAAATSFGFDFNPTVDRIRLVSNSGQNLRLNPNDGTLAATDGNLNPGTPSVSGAAYTNNFSGATSTILYVLDGTKLYKQDPPNNGTLVEVSSLNVTGTTANGFDIGGRTGMAYALINNGTTTSVYTVNLTTGNATATGTFASKVRGFALGLGF